MGSAWNIGSLITFRVFQGLGGGMLMPLGMTIMTRAAGPARIGRVMAVLGVPMLLGPIAGPILGGWLIEVASWHWIFFINLPIGIVAFIAAWRVLAKDSPTPSEKFDFLGMLLLSPGLALFLYGVSSIPGEGTVASARVLIPAIIGVADDRAASSSTRCARTHPLIDLHLFKRKQLSVSIITLSLFAIAFFGAMLLFPTYFISVRGETTLAAGLLLAPQGLGAMLTMPIAGRLTDKMGPGKFVLGGIVLIAVGMGVFTQITDTTSYVLILGSLFVMGMGMGMTMMPIMTAALASLGDKEVARGSTLMNIVQQAAASIGTAVMSVILTDQLLSKPAYEAGKAIQSDPSQAANFPPQLLAEIPSQMAEAFAFTFWVALVLILLTLIPAFLLPRKARQCELPTGEHAAALAGALGAADASDRAAVRRWAPVPSHVLAAQWFPLVTAAVGTRATPGAPLGRRPRQWCRTAVIALVRLPLLEPQQPGGDAEEQHQHAEHPDLPHGVGEATALADVVGGLDGQHHDLLDRGDDADQQERLGDQLAFGNGDPDREQQLDHDEDQQQGVQDLQRGLGSTVRPEQRGHLTGGDDEGAERQQHQEHRNPDVDNALGGLECAVAGADQRRHGPVRRLVVLPIDRPGAGDRRWGLGRHPLIMQSAARFGDSHRAPASAATCR